VFLYLWWYITIYYVLVCTNSTKILNLTMYNILLLVACVRLKLYYWKTLLSPLHCFIFYLFFFMFNILLTYYIATKVTQRINKDLSTGNKTYLLLLKLYIMCFPLCTEKNWYIILTIALHTMPIVALMYWQAR
jgi:hypothetical protein